MYQIPQEQKDQAFRGWITEQDHKIEILVSYGFSREQSIEMLKLQALQVIGCRG